MVLAALTLGSLPAFAAPGDLDPLFGTGGKVTTPIGTGFDLAEALILQPDGKLVAAGCTSEGLANCDFALVRYNADGSLDSTFGAGGKVTTAIGTGYDTAEALILQPDGKLVAAGTTVIGNDFNRQDFALVRYNADGSLDSTFGVGGRVTTSIGAGQDGAAALVLQPDGKLVAAGLTDAGPTALDFALVRYEADGSLDSTFGVGGKVTTAIGTGNDNAGALSLQPDGKLVAAGCIGSALGNCVFGLVRYNPDGSVDATFGVGGTVTTPIGSDAAPSALVLQSDGKLVAAGTGSNGANDYDFAMARYNADGSLDTTFGMGGTVVTPFGTAFDRAKSVIQQFDGKLVAAGYASNATDFDFALVRYNTNGSLDNSFGMGGKVTTPVGAGDDLAGALLMQCDGKLLAAGGGGIGPVSTGFGTDFALVRYLAGDGIAEPKAKLTLGKLNTPPGDDTLNFQGTLTLPPPTILSLNPLANGVQVVVDDTAGNLLNVTIPGGAFSEPLGTGWTVNTRGTSWTYQNKSPTPPGGISKVVIQDKSKGLVKFAVSGKAGSYTVAAADLPVSARIILTPTGRQCVDAALSCTLNKSGSTLKCK